MEVNIPGLLTSSDRAFVVASKERERTLEKSIVRQFQSNDWSNERARFCEAKGGRSVKRVK
jgi:hypothetical protein